MTSTKFRKKPGPKKKEKGEYLFDKSRRKELENKPTQVNSWRQPRFYNRVRLTALFGSLEVAITFLLFH